MWFENLTTLREIEGQSSQTDSSESRVIGTGSEFGVLSLESLDSEHGTRDPKPFLPRLETRDSKPETRDLKSRRFGG
jgi:hypothetical protein